MGWVRGRAGAGCVSARCASVCVCVRARVRVCVVHVQGAVEQVVGGFWSVDCGAIAGQAHMGGLARWPNPHELAVM